MNSTYLLCLLCIIGTVVLVNHFGNCQSSWMEERGAQSQSPLVPVSFEDRQLRRKRQGKGGGPNKARIGPPGHEEGNQILTISVTDCKENGMKYFDAYPDSYYVKCVRNYAHGGFYRVIYVCPRNTQAATDTTTCVPPPSCDSSCGKNNNNDDLGINGLV